MLKGKEHEASERDEINELPSAKNRRYHRVTYITPLQVPQ